MTMTLHQITENDFNFDKWTEFSKDILPKMKASFIPTYTPNIVLEAAPTQNNGMYLQKIDDNNNFDQVSILSFS